MYGHCCESPVLFYTRLHIYTVPRKVPTCDKCVPWLHFTAVLNLAAGLALTDAICAFETTQLLEPCTHRIITLKAGYIYMSTAPAGMPTTYALCLDHSLPHYLDTVLPVSVIADQFRSYITSKIKVRVFTGTLCCQSGAANF
jgi:hypothetical protein